MDAKAMKGSQSNETLSNDGVQWWWINDVNDLIFKSAITSFLLLLPGHIESGPYYCSLYKFPSATNWVN